MRSSVAAFSSGDLGAHPLYPPVRCQEGCQCPFKRPFGDGCAPEIGESERAGGGPSARLLGRRWGGEGANRVLRAEAMSFAVDVEGVAVMPEPVEDGSGNDTVSASVAAVGQALFDVGMRWPVCRWRRSL